MATDDLKHKPVMDPNQPSPLPDEMPENEWQAFVTKFNKWWDKYGNYVLLLMILVSGSLLGRKYYHQYLESQCNKSWGALAVATSPEVARSLAEDFDTPPFKAAAYLYSGDLLLHRAFKAKPTPSAVAAAPTSPATAAPAAPTDPAAAAAPAAPQDATSTIITAPAQPVYDRKKDLEESKKMYEQVLKIDGVDTIYKLNAMLGLGALAEEAQDAAAAVQWFSQVEAQAKQYPTLADQAKSRRERAQLISAPVVFGVEMPKPVVPSTNLEDLLMPGSMSPSPAPLLP